LYDDQKKSLFNKEYELSGYILEEERQPGQQYPNIPEYLTKMKEQVNFYEEGLLMNLQKAAKKKLSLREK
jgi:hypothetical protein